MATPDAAFEDLGPNSGLVEEMYRRFCENPDSVAASWREFFADYRGSTTRAPTGNGAPAVPAPPAPPTVAATVGAVRAGAEPEALRGAAARVVENMEASLAVPTATSVRTVPAKLLEVNRQILNNHLARSRGGKVSFTHLIAWAVVKGAVEVPAMRCAYAPLDGKPGVVRHDHLTLGLAVDVERRGVRSLLVPNIKHADSLDFSAFFAAYEELIRKVRTAALSPDDFAGTTATITNPGMIGTVHSVPRLMAGQGFIVGVGAIGYPAEYEGADPATLAELGVGKTITLTSTYDHRVIQGAESGEFLGAVHRLLLGHGGFYDEVFHSLAVPYEPARWTSDARPSPHLTGEHDKAVKVHQLVNMYRVRGHLIANLDPLGRREPKTHPELDLAHYGLSIWDLDRTFPAGGLAGRDAMTLREIMGVLRDAYARSVGVEYMHIQEPDQKAWIQERVEGVVGSVPPEDQRRILERLNAAEAFERFLHTKYLGQKRFSLEGAESLIPMLDALLSAAADSGVTEAVLGMAHRGRLSVLANVIGKSYGQIFREFEGELDLGSVQGSGDVKYHVGATGKHASPAGNDLLLTLASNPSHLEAVDPVVEGMVRAKGDGRGDVERIAVLPVLIHGDAAFAGQGVVAETLNLSEVDGFDVGGTVHIVVNNQLGFTTSPETGRSSVYATDVAKMVQAPIFHVNGDDPEAAVRVIRLAFDFRMAFRKDVVVDLVCYRRYGHNESDEPAFTQPRMYALIEDRRSVRKLYTEQLVNRGDISLEEAEDSFADFKTRLDAAFEETHPETPPPPPEPTAPIARTTPPPATAVEGDLLDRIVTRLTTWPESFVPHPKLEKLLSGHRVAFEAGTVDWALAEALAFGSLLLGGTPVRLAGQDTRRGTFSHRHGALVDTRTEAEFVPLANLAEDQAPYLLYDSVLSEFAALGFEYGYSVAAPEALVLWEAQFGDFMNGAQIVIDQFIVAAEDKWGQISSLTMLLPHGFEGQGPEHSSARIERFLALCAEENLRVAYPSTAAQIFHLLRRQALDPHRTPLVVFTPKRYLRVASTRSAVAELTKGRFQTVLDDPRPPDRVRRILVCTGKIGHELLDRRDQLGAPVAVVRVEQLYPWPQEDVSRAFERYPDANEILWVQEEPVNMGAWSYLRHKLERRAGDRSLRPVARPESASPASGSPTIHAREQEALLTTAFAYPD